MWSAKRHVTLLYEISWVVEQFSAKEVKIFYIALDAKMG